MNSVAAGVVLGLLSLSAYAQEPTAKGVNFYSLEREFQIGQEAAANLARRLPVIHDPKLDAYLGNLTAELVRHADPRFAYSFTVYEDRKLTGPQWVWMEMPVDAFHSPASEPIALAGGPVLVPLSLIAEAPDEAALVFQLAHAMAHVALRHSTRLATRQNVQDLVMIPLEQQADRAGGRLSGVVLASAAQTGMEAAFLMFARQFELAADQLATGMMAAAGYDPARAVSFVQGQPLPQPSSIYAAHPPAGKRVEIIQGRLEKLTPAEYAAQTGAFEEIKALAAIVH